MFMRTAIKEGKKSTYKQRMGAVVVYRNKIVGKGFNKVCSTGVPRLDGIHAEIEALNKTTAKYRKNSVVYVCRVNKQGNTVLAKPCKKCTKIMKKIGVKMVWYSVDKNVWKKMIL